ESVDGLSLKNDATSRRQPSLEKPSLMAPAVGLLLVVLGGQIGGHRETRFKLDDLSGMGRGGNGVAHLREDGGEESVMREVGARDPREGLGGFSELLSAVAGATEVIPE